jgi:hypothetical protein
MRETARSSSVEAQCGQLGTVLDRTSSSNSAWHDLQR